MENAPVHVVVSYVPLLTGEAGQTVDPNVESLKQLVDQIESSPGHVDGILWGVSPDGDPWPIFIIEDAAAIFNHLVDWSEGSPTAWFDFRLISRGDDYAMALIPKVEKTVARYRLAMETRTGRKLPEEINYQILFRALTFSASAGSGETFKLVKSKLRSPVKVGFIDKSVFADIREIPEDFNPEGICWAGPFEIQGDSDKFLESLLPKSRNRLKAARRKHRSK